MTPFLKARTQIQHRIEQACLEVGRDPKEVQLLAASKRTDAEGVMHAVADGHLLFGENRAQSFRDKYRIVAPQCPQANWHFIGHLQKNKIKYVVGKISMLHSLDSLELAQALNERIIKNNISPLNVLIQVKLGSEESKTGISPTDLFSFCHQVQDFPGLTLRGLMCIPPLEGTPEQWFSELATLAQQGREKGLPLHELSMGMSSDIEDAVKLGATIVRVGSALFCS
jgi:pyridoxal phosphate enzyme (YggS family)